MIAAVAAALIVAGGSFAYFAYRTGTEMLAEYGQDKAYTLAQYGRGVVEFMMLQGEKGHLQAAMRTIDSTGHIAALFLLRPDGRITVSTLPDSDTMLSMTEYKENPDFPGGMFMARAEDGIPYQYVMTPVKRKPGCSDCHKGSESVLGYMAVKITMDRIQQASMNHRTVNILMTVLTFGGIGAVISGALLFLVIRPVSRLRQQMRTLQNQLDRVEKGQALQFTPLVMSREDDEISGLITAFNALVHRLNEAHAVLHDLHQKQLEHADRLATTGEMAASMAHEIRNPLAGVLGALQVIDADMADPDPKKPIVQEMMVQMERMNLAVNDLLTYARPAPPKFDSTDLNGIIERTLSILNSQILKKNIGVEASLDRSLPPLTADKKLLQQLLWNLILNALQAMEPGGRLAVSTVAGDGSVTVSIRDTGKGIPARDRTNVFKPFFTTKHQGTGLGLTISRRIVEQHKGSIALESVENAGTTCTVRLPLIPEEDKA
ncbi:MAG TPA: ATP-binding protein [Bacteroidota bacterium]|nr:ATP-binding protein [Bacteroidota bacterium]